MGAAPGATERLRVWVRGPKPAGMPPGAWAGFGLTAGLRTLKETLPTEEDPWAARRNAAGP